MSASELGVEAPSEACRTEADLAPTTLDGRAAATAALLAADMVEEAGSGHPGLPMGMALPVWILFARHLRHDPGEPSWPDRDRFVLSAGHGSARPGVPSGWQRLLQPGDVAVGLHAFGTSGRGEDVSAALGLDVEAVVEAALRVHGGRRGLEPAARLGG